MAGPNAIGGPRRRKLAYATWAVALAVSLGLLWSVFGLFPSDGLGSADAPAAQPLFSQTKSTPLAQELVKLGAESGPPPQVELSGVVGGADGQRLAVVSVNKSPEAVVRVGDAIFKASTVTEINQDSLTYRHGSSLIRVVMRDRVAPPQGIASPAQLPNKELQAAAKENTLPGFVANTGTAVPQSSGELKNGNAEFRQVFEKKVNSLRPPP